MKLKHSYNVITGVQYFLEDEPKTGKEKRKDRRKRTNNLKPIT